MINDAISTDEPRIEISSLKISALESYLLHIYLTIKENRKNEFFLREVARSMGIQRLRTQLRQDLEDNEFIHFLRSKGNHKIFELTEKGKRRVFELIEKNNLPL